MDFIVSFFCKKDEPIKDNSDEEAKLVNNPNPIGEVVTQKEDTEPAITEHVENTVNNDDKKDEVDAVTNYDEVEDALMKAEETCDEDTLIQIVEDMLMKDDETEEEIEEEIEVDEDDEESI